MIADLVVPAGNFRAYLFDLDGTVADSMPLHYRAWSQAVREAGCEFPVQLFYQMGGIPLIRTVEILNEKFGYSMDPAVVVERKEALYYELLPELEPMVSVLKVLDQALGNVAFAIVSGSPRESIRRTLEQLALAHMFPLIVGAEDYVHGKPHPEPFLTAAKQLSVAPEECLVFEDAESGITAAKAAGMQVVVVPQPGASL